MKLRRVAVGPLLLSLCALGFACGANAQTKTLKLGYTLSPTSAYHAGAQAFAEEVAKLSAGRYIVQQFPSGALGGEKEMLESVQLGTQDFVLTSTGPVGTFVPETLITDIPFLFRDYDHARRVLDGPIGQEILAKFPAKNMVALAWAENGFRHLSNNKRDVSTPEDLKGIKVRTMENAVHMTAFRTLGAVPTPMPFPDLFIALQQGTVDGQENPIQVITSSKFGLVQKHLTLTGHVYSPALLIMSKPLFDGLSAADRKIFQDAAKLAAFVMRKRVNEIETSGVADLKAQGVTIITSIDKAKFQSALEPAYAEFEKRFGKENIERIKNFR